jgi:tetratricopeptide (TPR) repeat protein
MRRDAGILAERGRDYLERARSTADPAYYSLAGNAFERALRRDPEHTPALLGSGELALARHDFAEALAFGRSVRRLDPFDATALGIIGDAKLELGRYASAFSAYQRMVDLRPDLSSFARVSYARELTGDVSGAITAMRRAVIAGAGIPEDRAWTSTQLGDLYLGAGRLTLAERAYRFARSIDPDFVPALAGMARIAAARSYLVTAERRWARVVDRMPLPGYVVGLGDVRWEQGRRAAARRTYALARVQGRLAKAGGVLPDVDLTIFLADQGGAPELALRLARAQYRQRASIRTADALAWALFRNGKTGAARRLMPGALRLGTKDATLHYHAGMIAAGDDASSARLYLRRALAISPHFSIRYADVARRTLAALETNA